MRRPRHTIRTTVVLAASVALIAAACGDDGDDEAAIEDTTTTEAPGPEETAHDDDPLSVATDLGQVVGTDSELEGVRAFLNIPFAESPEGDNRWLPPQPHSGWDEPLQADEPGEACPQAAGGMLDAVLVIPEENEDCLTLSVWSPDDAADLPVVVWIHGGGLTTGSAHQDYYIGDNLAAEDVVVVSMNYRLGALGFLGHEDTEANQGIADQREAMEWVQRNVAEFGGDAENVTIMGESAGGFSVCAHLASEASQGLYDKAIIMSGGGCDRFVDPEQAHNDAEALMDELDCDDLDCMRALPTDELMEASFNTSIVADGNDITESSLALATAGELDVPVLIGANSDEATLFTLGMEEPDDDELAGLVDGLVDDADAVLELYPGGDYDTNLERYQAVFTDVQFVCPALGFAGELSEAYVYLYNYVSEGNPLNLGATHGAELALLFGHPEGLEIDVEPDDRSVAVAEEIREAWGEFALTSAPGPEWPEYSESGEVMVIDDPFEVTEEIRDGRCGELEDLIDGR